MHLFIYFPQYLHLTKHHSRDHISPANERRLYIEKSSLIGWAHTQNDPYIVQVNNRHAQIPGFGFMDMMDAGWNSTQHHCGIVYLIQTIPFVHIYTISLLINYINVGEFMLENVKTLVDYPLHYSDVIMSEMASHITGVSIVYSTVCSGADQRKHQSSASLALVGGIHRWPVNSPHKGPVTLTFRSTKEWPRGSKHVSKWGRHIYIYISVCVCVGCFNVDALA